jgi:hypothetical protein
MNAERRESALSRWSRRKLEARQQTGEDALEPVAEAPEEAQAAVENTLEPAAEKEKPVLTDADMPDIDSLDENSDFSPFMSSGVSDELRNLALRKLFRASVFNIRDGLDEYDDDFTSFEKLGDVVTCDMKHRIEMEQQKMRDALAEKETSEADEKVDDEALQAAVDVEVDTEGGPGDEAGDEAGGVRVAQAEPGADAEESVDER